MADLAGGNSSGLASDGKTRRSTRVFQSVPMSILGQNTLGNPFMELTSAVAMSCHGCLYPSRYEYRTGSWIMLQVVGGSNGKTQPVRAQVQFVRLPRSPKELYQVGVELEMPANIWGIKSPPEDWLRFPGPAGTAAGAAPATAVAAQSAALVVAENGIDVLPNTAGIEVFGRVAAQRAGKQALEPSGAPGLTKPVRVVVSSEQVLQALEGQLRQAAEKAVASAMSFRLGTVVSQVAKAIDDFSQASVRKVEEHCAQYREKLVTTAREDFLNRLQGDLAQAEARLQTQVETLLARAEEAAKRVETSAAQVQPVLAQAESFLHGALQAQSEFAGRMAESATRASAEFSGETARLSEQQIARLAEQAQATTGEAARRLESKADETRSQLETAAGTALAEFHVAAKDEMEKAVSECRRSVESSLASFGEETSADWEARLRACQDELAHSSEQEVAQFRERLAAVLSSSMIAAMSAVSEHSKALLDSLAKNAGQQLREAGRGLSSP